MVGVVLLFAMINLAVGYALGVILGRSIDHSAAAAIIADRLADILAFVRRRFGGSPAHEPHDIHPTSDVTVSASRAVPFASSPDERSTTADIASSESVEANIASLCKELAQYQDELLSIDSRVRTTAQSCDRSTIEHCVNDVRQANGQYLAHQANLVTSLQATTSARNAQFQQALERQTADIERANRKLDGLDLEGDLEATCRDILSTTSELSQSGTQVQELFEEIRAVSADKIAVEHAAS